MIIVLIHKGEGSYRSIIPMLPWYNYFIPQLQYRAWTGFQEIKKNI